MFDRLRAIEAIGQGRCPCPDCGGRLTNPHQSPAGWAHCRRCRCAWRVAVFVQRPYPITVPEPACRVWSPHTPARSERR